MTHLSAQADSLSPMLCFLRREKSTNHHQTAQNTIIYLQSSKKGKMRGRNYCSVPGDIPMSSANCHLLLTCLTRCWLSSSNSIWPMAEKTQISLTTAHHLSHSTTRVVCMGMSIAGRYKWTRIVHLYKIQISWRTYLKVIRFKSTMSGSRMMMSISHSAVITIARLLLAHHNSARTSPSLTSKHSNLHPPIITSPSPPPKTLST